MNTAANSVVVVHGVTFRWSPTISYVPRLPLLRWAHRAPAPVVDALLDIQWATHQRRW